MSAPVRWYRQDPSESNQDWFADLPAEARLAWRLLKDYVCSVHLSQKRPGCAPAFLARRAGHLWNLSPESVEAMVGAAVGAGRLVVEGDEWRLTQRTTFQAESAERMRRKREEAAAAEQGTLLSAAEMQNEETGDERIRDDSNYDPFHDGPAPNESETEAKTEEGEMCVTDPHNGEHPVARQSPLQKHSAPPGGVAGETTFVASSGEGGFAQKIGPHFGSKGGSSSGTIHAAPSPGSPPGSLPGSPSREEPSATEVGEDRQKTESSVQTFHRVLRTLELIADGLGGPRPTYGEARAYLGEQRSLPALLRRVEPHEAAETFLWCARHLIGGRGWAVILDQWDTFRWQMRVGLAFVPRSGEEANRGHADRNGSNGGRGARADTRDLVVDALRLVQRSDAPGSSGAFRLVAA